MSVLVCTWSSLGFIYTGDKHGTFLHSGRIGFLTSAVPTHHPTPILTLWRAKWVHNSEKVSEATEELILSVALLFFF